MDSIENMSELPAVDIHTSDCNSFRRCRRRWGWSSHLRQGLQIAEAATPLWLGTGMHYALEDFHGYNKYGSPVEALQQFCDACRRTPQYQLPDDWSEALELGRGMMEHYIDWLANRDPLETLYIDGVPQVEVKFSIPLPQEFCEQFGRQITYDGTFDRMSIDGHKNLWIVEYKSAKQFQDAHFPTDSQVSRYSWAASCLYNLPVAGVIYQQHKKAIPEEPRLLAGGMISTAKNQKTTHALYKRSLENLYQTIDNPKVPAENIKTLNMLAQVETEASDQFIRRDIVTRNRHSIEAEGVKILLEVEDMLNPDLPLYPNPTKDCSWDCRFNTACVSLDDGSDWEHELKQLVLEEKRERDPWRQYLV